MDIQLGVSSPTCWYICLKAEYLSPDLHLLSIAGTVSCQDLRTISDMTGTQTLPTALYALTLKTDRPVGPRDTAEVYAMII